MNLSNPIKVCYQNQDPLEVAGALSLQPGIVSSVKSDAESCIEGDCSSTLH